MTYPDTKKIKSFFSERELGLAPSQMPTLCQIVLLKFRLGSELRLGGYVLV